MKISGAMRTCNFLSSRLSGLCWARRQALLQEQDAAGEEKERWQVVIAVIDQAIREQERFITEYMGVLKFRVKGEFVR